MNSEPDEAASGPTSKIIQFNIQEASAEALAESQKPVLKAKAQLDKDGAFKEVVKTKEELAGRSKRRAAEDRWQGKVNHVTGHRFGLVKDARNFTKSNEPSMTKVQPVPSRTADTETLRLERGSANLLKARNEDRVREFVSSRIVPLMQDKPDQTSNLRVVLKELGMTEEGKEKRTMLPNLQLSRWQWVQLVRTSMLCASSMNFSPTCSRSECTTNSSDMSC